MKFSIRIFTDCIKRRLTKKGKRFIQKVFTFKNTLIIADLIFSIGIALFGYFIGNSFLKAKSLDRYVTVKGLAEKEVISDLAIWPIIVTLTGNNLTEVNKKIELDRNIVISFLIDKGFKHDEIEISNYTVTDLLAQIYYNSDILKNFLT